MKAHWITRRLRSVQGLRDLCLPYIAKIDDCDWLVPVLARGASLLLVYHLLALLLGLSELASRLRTVAVR
jgi:hypothetical protein